MAERTKKNKVVIAILLILLVGVLVGTIVLSVTLFAKADDGNKGGNVIEPISDTCIVTFICYEDGIAKVFTQIEVERGGMIGDKMPTTHPASDDSGYPYFAYWFNYYDDDQIHRVDSETVIVEDTQVWAMFTSTPSDNPDVGDNPDTPDNPDSPDTPDNPDNPDTPDNPDKPTEPIEPDNPDTPNTPDKPTDPVEPDNPSKPDTPIEPTYTYTVTFKNGDMVVKTLADIEYGTRLKADDFPTDPEPLSGQKFDGWYIGDTKIQAGYKVSGNVTITAEFIQELCTVTFRIGDTVVKTLFDVNYGMALKAGDFPSDPEAPSGFIFVGWCLGDVDIAPGYVVRRSVTLTARFVQASYTVSFVDGANFTIKQVAVSYGKALTSSDFPTDPEAPNGQVFDGWYVGETKVTTNYIIYENVTAIAKFVPMTCTVMFIHSYTGDTIKEFTIEYKKALTSSDIPADPEPPSGQVFDGWYIGKTKVEVGYEVKDNVRIYAVFSERTEDFINNLGFVTFEANTMVSYPIVSDMDYSINDIYPPSSYVNSKGEVLPNVTVFFDSVGLAHSFDTTVKRIYELDGYPVASTFGDGAIVYSIVIKSHLLPISVLSLDQTLQTYFKDDRMLATVEELKEKDNSIECVIVISGGSLTLAELENLFAKSYVTLVTHAQSNLFDNMNYFGDMLEAVDVSNRYAHVDSKNVFSFARITDVVRIGSAYYWQLYLHTNFDYQIVSMDEAIVNRGAQSNYAGIYYLPIDEKGTALNTKYSVEVASVFRDTDARDDVVCFFIGTYSDPGNESAGNGSMQQISYSDLAKYGFEYRIYTDEESGKVVLDYYCTDPRVMSIVYASDMYGHDQIQEAIKTFVAYPFVGIVEVENSGGSHYFVVRLLMG